MSVCYRVWMEPSTTMKTTFMEAPVQLREHKKIRKYYDSVGCPRQQSGQMEGMGVVHASSYPVKRNKQGGVGIVDRYR